MKIIRNSAIFAAAVLAVACSKEEKTFVDSQGQGTPVHFNMTVGSMPVSRTVTGDGTAEGTRNVAWRNGDEVGIFVNGQQPAHVYVYEEAGDGIWKEASETDAIYALPGNTYDFHSWYPYNTDVVRLDGTELEASVFADQNRQYGDNSGYDLSDVLLASSTNVNGNDASAVELKFSHAFAMVEVLVSGSDVTVAPDAVTLRNIRRTASVKPLSKTVTLKEDAPAENVVMCRIEPVKETSGYLFRAIVPAQTINAGEMLLEIGLAGKTYVFKSPGVAYVASRYRRIEALIGEGKAGLTFPAGSIDAWEPSEELPPVSGDEKQEDLVRIKIADLTADSFRQTTAPGDYLHDQNYKDWINETLWTMSTHSSEEGKVTGEVVDIDGAKALKFYSEAGLSYSFYKSGIRYHHVEGFAPGYYRLKITAKKAGESSKLIVYIRTDKTTAHNRSEKPDWCDGLYFGFLESGDLYNGRTFVEFKTDDWEETVAYVDFNRALNSSYSTSVTAGVLFEDVSDDSEAYDYFDLAIMPNSGGKQEFYIRDVELIKVTEEEFNSQK